MASEGRETDPMLTRLNLTRPQLREGLYCGIRVAQATLGRATGETSDWEGN
jgi:hypothetical protein